MFPHSRRKKQMSFVPPWKLAWLGASLLPSWRIGDGERRSGSGAYHPSPVRATMVVFCAVVRREKNYYMTKRLIILEVGWFRSYSGYFDAEKRRKRRNQALH